MENYSIMPLFEDHMEEICQDVKAQYENGTATCALFLVKLVPEGIPAIDKARRMGEIYKRFSARLAEMGLECGILVQCTIGHGYPLNQENAFQNFVPLNGDTMREYGTVCPYDESFRAYMTDQFKTLASYNPKVIMVDDDFRLMARQARGCGCPLHISATEKRVGEKMDRATLFSVLTDKAHEKHDLYRDAYVDSVKESLLDCAKAMRAGIDAVDPKLKGIFCLCGRTTEFASDIAEILAGEGNPPTVRVNNGNYTPAGPRYLSYVSYRAAQQMAFLDERVKVRLAETDTCPQNRYSTGAYSLHSHFVASILEGAAGAKHWITRLATFEPESGKAYRRVLGKYSGFYNTLSALVPTLHLEGCRIPLQSIPKYEFTGESDAEKWSYCVLERLGLPMYFSKDNGGATFFDDERADGFTDAEIEKMLEGTLVLSAKSAKALEERGFSHLTGVRVRQWEGLPITGEIIDLDINRKCARQNGTMELIPAEGAESTSTVYHLHDGKDIIPLFPGCVYFENEKGGKCITFTGTPKAEFHYTQAFSFLNQSRKAQMIHMLSRTGNLPLYYVGDEEVYFRYGTDENGCGYAFLFNIGTDPIEEIVLQSNRSVEKILALSPDGKWEEISFVNEKGRLTLNLSAITLMPVVLKLI